jgi:hypothetical protein
LEFVLCELLVFEEESREFWMAFVDPKILDAAKIATRRTAAETTV